MKKSPTAIEIKGFGNDVNIILSNESAFSDIESELLRRLKSSNRFFSGTSVILDAGDRVISLEECEKLKKILDGKFNLNISFVRSRSSETRKAVEEIGWKVEPQIKGKENTKKEDTRIPGERESDTILIKRTVRSGQREFHRGNIVILGDVNPGAEVVATGDIVILGKLRGIAHAGVEGNTSAIITALGLHPIQLRIAEHIGRSPDLEPTPDNVPEVARVEEGNIVIRKLR